MQNLSDYQIIFSDTEKLELKSDSHPFALSFRISTFESSSEQNRFIKNCERLIRISAEYKHWREYIRDVLEINSCFLTNESSDECTVEIHHHIPSLFTIVKGVVNKKISNQEEFCTFDICLEVMRLHFENRVGYVCLVKTLHEKFHNGFLEIPVELVQGDYVSFLNEYEQYLDPEDIDTIRKRLAVKAKDNQLYFWSKDNYPRLRDLGV